MCEAVLLAEPGSPHQPFYKATLVYGADLIEKDPSTLFCVLHRKSKRRRVTAGRHRSNDRRPQIIVDLWRRDYDAGTRLLNLTAHGGIKTHQPYVTALDGSLLRDRRAYHVHSRSASFANSGKTSASSPSAAIFLLASAHPARVGADGFRKTRVFPSTCISTSSDSPTCFSTGFGIRIPRELPKRLIATSMPLPSVLTMLSQR